jgi:uncharacterized membrane protein YgdD (TMEM256/DUF423 family)
MTNSTLQKNMLQVGASFAALAVIMGAFAAHELKPVLGNTDEFTFETGTKYQFYHSIALIALCFGMRRVKEEVMRAVFVLFVIGIILFSGSLYLLATSKLWGGGDRMDWIGAITPFGGIAFIAGWIYLAWKGYKPSSSEQSDSGNKIMRMQRRRTVKADSE